MIKLKYDSAHQQWLNSTQRNSRHCVICRAPSHYPSLLCEAHDTEWAKLPYSMDTPLATWCLCMRVVLLMKRLPV